VTNISKLKVLLFAGVLAISPLVAGEAVAHGSMKPQHGGEVALTGDTLVELVRAPSGVTVYVTDDDGVPLSAAGMTGKLIVTQGAKKSEAPLKSGAGNQLDAAGLKIPAGAKVTVMLVDNATQAHSMVSFTAK
jgi:hypothetical protein